MKTRVIFFDLDDTLFPAEAIYQIGLRAAWQRLRREKRLSWPQFRRVYARARREVKAQLVESPAARSRPLYFKRMTEILFGRTRARLVLELSKAYETCWKRIDPRPARRVAAVLSRRYRLAVLTNQLALFQLAKMARIDPDGKYFSLILTSEEVGCEKPDPRFFREACRWAGCRPEEAVLVGNSWTDDVLGPLRAGWHAVYVHPGLLKQTLPPHAVQVRRLDDLRGLFMSMKA